MRTQRPVDFAKLENLENRRLLSGLTLVTHGQGGDAGDEVGFTADLIERRAGGAAQYVMKVERSGTRVRVASFERDEDSPAIEDTSSGEQIVKLDWSDVKTLPTTAIAGAVADYMVGNGLVRQQLHLAGPSRGASVISNLAAELGKRGVWVDHVTYIDPVPAGSAVPFFGDLFDGKMKVTENVLFADNYWRSDDNITNGFDGQSVRGAYNVELNMVQADNFGDPHVGAGAYYIATIDPEEPIVPPAKSSWFAGTRERPARDRTGYFFSRIVGGARPKSGVSAGFDGTARRDGVDRDGSQFPNIDGLKVVGGRRRFAVGEQFKISYRFNDADSAANIAFVIDDDRNPYNNWVATLARRDVGEQRAPTVQRARVGKSNLDAGDYFLAARIKDNQGHVRYAYSTVPIELTGSARAQSVAMIGPAPTAGAFRRTEGLGLDLEELI